MWFWNRQAPNSISVDFSFQSMCFFILTFQDKALSRINCILAKDVFISSLERGLKPSSVVSSSPLQSNLQCSYVKGQVVAFVEENWLFASSWGTFCFLSKSEVLWSLYRYWNLMSHVRGFKLQNLCLESSNTDKLKVNEVKQQRFGVVKCFGYNRCYFCHIF